MKYALFFLLFALQLTAQKTAKLPPVGESWEYNYRPGTDGRWLEKHEIYVLNDKCLVVLTAFAYLSAPDTIIPISFKGVENDKAQMFLDDAKFENGVINSPSGTVTAATWLKNNGLSTKLIYFLRKKKPRA